MTLPTAFQQVLLLQQSSKIELSGRNSCTISPQKENPGPVSSSSRATFLGRSFRHDSVHFQRQSRNFEVISVLKTPPSSSRASSGPDDYLINIKDEKHWNSILEEAGDALVVADFFATWCRKCVYLMPRLKKLAIKYPDVVFTKINVNEVGGVPKKAGIERMPTLQLYKHKQLLFSFIGGEKGDAVAERLAGLIEEMSPASFVLLGEPVIEREAEEETDSSLRMPNLANIQPPTENS